MSSRSDEAWKKSSLVASYLESVRGAIPLAKEQLDVMLRLIAACQRPVRRFLDLGCGDGVLSSAILAAYPEAHGVLADFSPPMLEAAAQRLAAHAGSVEVLNMDYAFPSWAERVRSRGPFDVVVSGYSIHHQPDTRKREIYAEILSLLDRGAIFVHLEHIASASPWVAAVHEELFIDSLHRHQPAKSREEVEQAFRHRLDETANLLAPVDVQCQWLREIGFTEVDCYLKIFELAVFGGRRP